jgi:hypothetical protein
MEDRHASLNATEGGIYIDTHRATPMPSCTQQRCESGRKPCPTPKLCVFTPTLSRPVPTSALGRLLRFLGML